MSDERRRDALIREEYAKAPTLAPLSRTPMSYDVAAAFGTRSASQARRRADARLAEEGSR